MEKKTSISLFLSLATILGLASCSGGTNSSSQKIISSDDPEYYNKINERARFDENAETNIEEDFTNGMDNDTWYAFDGAWHTDSAGWEHNGLQKRNLFYTTDENNNSYLAIRGRGFYNTDDPATANKPEGGGIISKKHLGPGRYEISMAAMPREGGVSTMWTYCTTTGSEATSQNEIDIELGGTSSGGTQFEEYWATTWTTHTNKQTDKINVPEMEDLGFYLNDGKIHKYTFDWYTEYPGEDGGRVDWFVDGVFTKSISGTMVPDHEMPLWVGLWFPPAWAGSPSFYEDYFLIDKVSFKAFSDADQYYDSCRSEPGYTKFNPSEVDIQTIPFTKVTSVNKLSNGNFESLDICPNDKSYYGWIKEDACRGEVTLSNDKTLGSSSFKLTSGTKVEGEDFFGEYIYQKISNAFEGYKYSFSIDAKIDKGSTGNIEITYKNKTGKVISTKSIAITSEEFKNYTYEIVMPKGSAILEIHLTSEEGSAYYDNASLIFNR